MSVKNAENTIKNYCLSLQSQLYMMIASLTPRDVDETGSAPATVTVAFELVQQNNEIYILIQATDNYEI
jgi:hypothetical protein